MALTALLGFIALAIDAGNLVENRTNFQDAADAAALSAATVIRESPSAATPAQDEMMATTAAESIAGGYGVTGNWGTCITPGGFLSDDRADSCVAFDQYNLAATAVGTATPALTVSAPSTGTAGVLIANTDITATLSGGSNLQGTGTVTFTVFGPQTSAPSSCATTGQSDEAVVGSTTVSDNGPLNPPAPGFTPSGPGNYWWYASFNGDENNAPAYSGCSEETVVGQAVPTLTLSAPDNATVGTPIPSGDISAVLSGASDPNGDTITFSVFASPTAPACPTATAAWTDTVTVTGNGPYGPSPSNEFTPTSPGNYWWEASLAADPDNTPASSDCAPPPETTASPASGPVLALSAPDYDTVGTAIPASAINAIVSGTSGATTGDTVNFVIFGPQSNPPSSCTLPSQPDETVVGGPVTMSGDGTYIPTAAYSPTQAGQYWWFAFTVGDANNPPLYSSCGNDEITVGESVAGLTISAPDTGIPGTLIANTEITATLSGTSDLQSGDKVSFTVFGPQQNAPVDCTVTGQSDETTLGSTTVTGNGPVNPPSPGYTPPGPGNYWWYASFGGDADNQPSYSDCGVAETTVGLTAATITLGVPNTDSTGTAIPSTAISASLAGASGNPPGGAITFWTSGVPGPAPTSCPGSTSWTQLGANVTVSGNTTYYSTSGFTPSDPGEYWWYASYSGDANNASANSGCEETVVQTTENLSVTAPSVSAVGADITATATLSGPNPGPPLGTTPAPYISFWVYGPGSEPTSCPDTTDTAGWTEVGGTVAVNDGYGSYTSSSFTVPGPGNYWWYASYSGDPNDPPTDSGCGFVISVQIPSQNVATLFGTGGGGALGTSAFAFGSAASDLSDGKLCYYPGDCEDSS